MLLVLLFSASIPHGVERRTAILSHVLGPNRSSLRFFSRATRNLLIAITEMGVIPAVRSGTIDRQSGFVHARIGRAGGKKMDRQDDKNKSKTHSKADDAATTRKSGTASTQQNQQGGQRKQDNATDKKAPTQRH